MATTGLHRGIQAAALMLALGAGTCFGQVRLEVDAVAGEPFGVARVLVEAPAGAALDQPHVEGIALFEERGRVLYPAFGSPPVRGLLSNLLGAPQSAVTAYFLFEGNEPLELRLFDRRSELVSVRPMRDPAAHERLLQEWWRIYSGNQPVRKLLDLDEEAAPLTVKNYLTAMLAQRLALRMPPEARLFERPRFERSMGPVLGTERLRLAVQRETMLDRQTAEEANPELPPPLELPPAEIPPPPDKVQVEPLALHVPEECFYVRCGSYANFQWLRDFLADAGGDVRNLVTVRGVSYGLNARLEQQLVLKSSVLSELLGDVVVADVALIGTDMFFREGPSIGLVFQARNNLLLANNITEQRTALLRQNDEAREETFEINGRDVSFLSTPDNQVRSFYVTDGDYHLVTTSRAIAERFLEAGAGERALGASAEFRHARAMMPLERRDTIFAFFSTPFVRNLASPAYRIEMLRRLKAAGDLELVQLARLAAQGEGKPSETLDELVAGGFLPRGFEQRPDGSHPVLEDGEVYDSLRGDQGWFIPVPDVEVEAATAAEIEAYAELADYARERVQRLDPVMAGLKRYPADDQGYERLVVDARFSPFAQEHSNRLVNWLSGPPDQQRLVPLPGDLIAVEAILGGQHVFAGLKDSNPLKYVASARSPVEVLLGSLAAPPLENLVGYLGAVSNGGELPFLRDFRYGPPDAQGYSRAGGRIWRRQVGPYVVLSFQRQVLENVTPLLAFEPAERPAHGRLRIGDLRQSQLAEMIDALAGRRAELISFGNARLMNSLVQQVRIDAAESRAAVEQLLGAKLLCPLGGDYVLDQPSGLWVSTAWSDNPRQQRRTPPRGYHFPVFNWFRGLEADFLLDGPALATHAEITMRPLDRQAAERAAEEQQPPEDQTREDETRRRD